MKMIIDGKKVDSLSGETFDVINPATGKVIESVPNAKSGYSAPFCGNR